MRLLCLTYDNLAPKERRGRSPDEGYDLTINVDPKVRRLPGLRRPVADPKPRRVGRRVAAPVAAAVDPMLRRAALRAVGPVAAAVGRAVADRSRLGLGAALGLRLGPPCPVRCR